MSDANKNKPRHRRFSNMMPVLPHFRSQRHRYEHHHSESGTTLPSTNQGTHPALVLIRQKGLECRNVCEQRRQATAQVLAEVGALPILQSDAAEEPSTELTKAVACGFIDQAEFRNLLVTICNQAKEKTISDQEAETLMVFVPHDQEGTVAKDAEELQSRLTMILTLWWICCKNKESWSKVVNCAGSKLALLEAMRELNHGEKVELREATWLLEKCNSINTSGGFAATKLLVSIAYWYTAPQARSREGLDREQLLVRVNLERRLKLGCLRFVAWSLVFLSIMVAVTRGSKLEQCRGIKGNLETQLELKKLASVTTLKEVKGFVKDFSRLTAKLSPLSRVYFGGGDVWVLQDAGKTFVRSEPMPTLLNPREGDQGDGAGRLLPIGQAFTLQAWVKLDYQGALPRRGLSLLRKALGRTGVDRQLSCWGWRFPPAFDFGAHDYGYTVPNVLTSLMEERVEVTYAPPYVETQRSVLHTLIVTATQAIFMGDDRVLATIQLERPITDCVSDDFSMGDSGLTLAAVRFYPRALLHREVIETFKLGAPISRIGYVISSQKAKPMDEVEKLSLGVTYEINRLQRLANATLATTWSAAQLTGTSVAASAKPATLPYVNADHNITAMPADPVTGHAYWEVYASPVYTNEMSKNMANSTLLPQAPGRSGFTLSTWLKVNSREDAGYFVSRVMPVYAGNSTEPLWTGWSNMCWMIWVGSDYTGFYTRSGAAGERGDGPSYFVNDLAAEPGWHFVGKSYRHFVFQIDPTDTQRPLRVCIDSRCSGEAVIDQYAVLTNQSFPPAADCGQTGLVMDATEEFKWRVGNDSKLWLNRRPIDNFPLKAWQMSTKYFDRVLTKAEIKELFERDPDPEDRDGKAIKQTKGCRTPAELVDDPTFKDSFGNDCYWYFQTKATRPEVCESIAAIDNCPMACGSRETCWGAVASNGTDMQIWKQQMEFRSTGVKGTTCVAKSTTPEAEAIKCALNAPNYTVCHQLRQAGHPVECGPRNCSSFAGDRPGLLACLGNTHWVPSSADATTRYDYFMPCSSIILGHMPACDWDDTGLDVVMAEANVSKEWSISFWFEVLREGCLAPQLRLLDGGGGTFSWVGGLDSLVDDTTKGIIDGCNTEVWLGHGLIGPQAGGHQGGSAGSRSADITPGALKPGRKHILVFGRRKDGSPGLQLDDTSDFHGPLSVAPVWPDRSFLRVINVGGDIRMSPWTLRSYFPQQGEIGSWRFSQQVEQDRRTGPLRPLHQQLEQELVRYPTSFAEKAMLLAPPLLLQTRKQVARCISEFSNRIIDTVQRQGSSSQCATPYACPEYTQDSVYQCASGAELDDAEFFGSRPLKMKAEHGKRYMEFLQSIADNEVLVRNSTLPNGERVTMFLKTDHYLDLLSELVEIEALFYSVEFSITSLMKISFEVDKGKVLARTELKHYVASTSDVEPEAVTLLIIALVLLVVILLDLAPATRKHLEVFHKMHEIDWHSIGQSLLDTALAIVTFIIALLLLLRYRNSQDKTEELVGAVSRFDWTVESENLDNMKRSFMDAFGDIQREIADYALNQSAVMLLSIALLFRIVTCTNVHPRLELITRTVTLAFSDLAHFLLLFCIVFFGFALLGHGLFGNEREEFSSVQSSFFTLFDCILGPPGKMEASDQRLNSTEVYIYVVMFHVICFFFVLNFILAIIVDSYTKVMEEVRECVVEQDIISDLVSLFKYQYLVYRYKLPLRRVILHYLKTLACRVVTADDLYHPDQDIFPSQEAAEVFYNHYKKYDFLDAEATGAKHNPTQEDLAMLQAMTMHKVELVQDLVQSRRSMSQPHSV